MVEQQAHVVGAGGVGEGERAGWQGSGPRLWCGAKALSPKRKDTGGWEGPVWERAGWIQVAARDGESRPYSALETGSPRAQLLILVSEGLGGWEEVSSGC